MTIVKAGPAAWTWSEDVLAFAREAGVEQYLDGLMAATRELFPGAEEMEPTRALVLDADLYGNSLGGCLSASGVAALDIHATRRGFHAVMVG